MAKVWNPDSYFLLFVTSIIINLQVGVSVKKLPAIFIFGDSTMDVGTNNYLPSPFTKANFPYNGIDFPNSKPTGRFCNGYNIADELAMLMGFKNSPPAYLYILNHTTSIDLIKKMVQQGVNFASGGSGILDETGLSPLKAVIPMKEQIQQFATVRGNISNEILSRALYILSVGTNDIFDYFEASNTIPKQQFMSSLESSFHEHLKNLYSMGARKFGIIGVPPTGCSPYARAYNKKRGSGDGCMEQVNEFAKAFHNTSLVLLQRISSELPEMKYSIGNTFDMAIYLIQNYPSFGFKEIKNACCGFGNYNGEVPCYKLLGPNLCQNRSEYLFWDPYHPSQATYQLIAAFLYRGATNYMSPMNFSQLAKLN